MVYISLLKQNTIKKEQVDEMTSRLEFKNESNNKVYKIEAFCNNKIDAKESNSNHSSGLYYLVL